MMWTDFHTHNQLAAPGTAIVNLPEEALLCPVSFDLMDGAFYSAGIHPWWTAGSLEQLWQGLLFWSRHPQVVAIGECGLDKLRGADILLQKECFVRQVELAESCHLPVTIHCVKAFDQMLSLHKQIHPTTQWTIHGFRGKPDLARQLLMAGFNLSFGRRYNVESWDLTPPDRRYRETDDDW